MNETENLARGVREAAAAIAAHIVPVTLDITNHASVPRAGLSTAEFTEFVRGTRPRVIYLYEATFDVDQAIESALTKRALKTTGKAPKQSARLDNVIGNTKDRQPEW